MTLNLTNEELFDLTGLRQKAKQAAWLKANKFIFVLNAQSQPKVARAHYEARMGVKARTETIGPNWAALKTPPTLKNSR